MFADVLHQETSAFRGRRLLFAPVFFGAGIGVYFALRFEPDLLWSFAALLAALAVVILGRRLRVASLLVLGMLALAGFTHAGLRAHLVGAPVIEQGVYNIEGRVIGMDRNQGGRLRLLLGELWLSGLEQDATPARVRVTVRDDAARFRPGDRVQVKARLSPPSGPVEPGGFDFRRYAWFRSLGGVGFSLAPAIKATVVGQVRPMDRVTAVRLALSNQIEMQIGGREGGFAAAIFTGDRSHIDQDSLEDLRASNLAHLLAISGLHMGLLTGFVFALVRIGLALFPQVAQRLSCKKIAAVAAIAAGLTYLILSGASVATQRAFVMVLVMFAAVLMDRRAVTLRAVAIAAMIVLAVRPESLTEAGFQMSFAATCALVAGFEALSKQNWWRKPRNHWAGRIVKGAAALMISSALAGAATAPFSAYHFNAIAQYGLIANLAAVPMMGFVVMPCGVLAGLLALIGLEGPFLWLAGIGIGGILGVAEFVANLEGSRRFIPATQGIWLLLVVAGGLLLVLCVSYARFVGFALIGLALWFWQSAPRPDVLISADGKLIGVMTSDGRALSRAKGAGFVAERWLENDGDPSLQKVAFERPIETARAWVHDDASGSSCAGRLALVQKDARAPKDCASLKLHDLLGEGAVALYLDGEIPEIRHADKVVGARLWVNP